MYRHLGQCCGILMLALAWAFPPPVMAQYVDEHDAVMSARAFLPIEKGTRIAIQLADNTELNERLAATLSETLRRSGFQVVEREPVVVLRLETRHYTDREREDRSVGRLNAGSGQGRPDGVGVDLNLRLWSTTRNSLLKPTRPEAAPKPGFAVILDAYNEQVGKAAWRGDARSEDSGGDSFRAGESMIRHLVEIIGVTAAPTEIRLW